MRKILIIRFSSIGDIVLTTPVIRALAMLPDTEVHFLTKSAYAEILQHNPYITSLHTIKSQISEVLPALRLLRFDHIIDLHRNIRSRHLILMLRRPGSTFPKLNIRKWLTVRFKRSFLPDVHIVDRYFRAVKPLGAVNDGKGLDYFLGSADLPDPVFLPESHKDGYIAFVIGGKHNTKIFPEAKVISTCRFIQKPVLLLGGPEDSERGNRIATASGKHVSNACGKYSLNQSAWLVKQAEKVITNDTGLMHIAAAFRRPVLSIWGNTIPAFGMTPYFPVGEDHLSYILEVKDLSCRPCSKLGFSKCPKGHFDCMNRLDEGLIAAWANS